MAPRQAVPHRVRAGLPGATSAPARPGDDEFRIVETPGYPADFAVGADLDIAADVPDPAAARPFCSHSLCDWVLMVALIAALGVGVWIWVS